MADKEPEVVNGKIILRNGVTVEAAYSGRHERRHLECVNDGDKIIDGPPITPDYPRRVETMTDESYQGAIEQRRKCAACGKVIE